MGWSKGQPTKSLTKGPCFKSNVNRHQKRNWTYFINYIREEEITRELDHKAKKVKLGIEEGLR